MADRAGPSPAGPATGCLYDPVFLRHSLPGHPERPERLQAIVAGLREADLWNQLAQVPARAATDEELLRAHTPEHLECIAAVGRAGGGHLDPDTYMNHSSHAAALVAAGGLIDLALAVAAGRLQNGFALVRPPGHHATREWAMGFCLLNNVALAAQAVRQTAGIQRLAIVDFDVHHGNGTQDILAGDPGALYVSTHQSPHYPGTGRLDEIGEGAAAGTIVNVPLPAGTGDQGFGILHAQVIRPVLDRFQPEFMFVSAGFDGHWADPLAGLGLSLRGLAALGQRLCADAARLCAGKIVFTLEGGYDLDVLGAGVANCIKALLGRTDFADPLGPAGRQEPDLTRIVQAVRQAHNLS